MLDIISDADLPKHKKMDELEKAEQELSEAVNEARKIVDSILKDLEQPARDCFYTGEDRTIRFIRFGAKIDGIDADEEMERYTEIAMVRKAMVENVLKNLGKLLEEVREKKRVIDEADKKIFTDFEKRRSKVWSGSSDG